MSATNIFFPGFYFNVETFADVSITGIGVHAPKTVPFDIEVSEKGSKLKFMLF